MYLEIVLFITFLLLIWIMMKYYIEKAKRNIETRNNILSGLYFIIDMGPNISSVAVIAIVIMPKGVTILQLITVFFLGIMLKKVGRMFKTLFYKKLSLKGNSK